MHLLAKRLVANVCAVGNINSVEALLCDYSNAGSDKYQCNECGDDQGERWKVAVAAEFADVVGARFAELRIVVDCIVRAATAYFCVHSFSPMVDDCGSEYLRIFVL